MRSLWRTTIGLAAASVAMVTTLGTTSGTAAAAPPPQEVGLANLALTQMLTRGPDGVAVTAYGLQTLPQVWDRMFIVHVPAEDGMSSPFQLRSNGTGLCLEDLGEGRPVIAVGCEALPSAESKQLWQIHRLPDRRVDNRNYYYQINRSSRRVLTGQATTPGAEGTPVISATMVPVSKSGAADGQLWVTLVQ
jgi:hypothetical protein